MRIPNQSLERTPLGLPEVHRQIVHCVDPFRTLSLTQMPIFIALLLVFLLITVVRADPGPDEEAFLALPGAQVITPPGYANPVLETIPADLQKLLAHYDWGGIDGSVPKEFHGFVFDLKQEGKKAYFIVDLGLSGSGGTGYLGFYEFPEGWREIADFQGPLYLYPSPCGTWPTLVYTTRGGGGIWAKTYMKFSKESYQDIATQHYERGVITWDKPASN
jgi:hypothetical protein